MIGVYIVTSLCLALMTLWLAAIVFNLFTKSRAERITYIRNFKKGKGILIYLFALPLFWIASVHGGEKILNGFFVSVKRIVELVVLKFDFSPLKDLMQANILFSVAIYICFTLVCMNAVMFALSLLNQYLWNYLKRTAFALTGKERLIIFGDNPQNHSIYSSDKVRKKMLVDKLTDKESLALYMKNISHIGVNAFGGFICGQVRKCVKGKPAVVVINTGDDEKNITLCRAFTNCFDKLSYGEKKAIFGVLRIFVFGNPEYEALYEDIVADAYGCISYINKYQKIAMDFIDEYPFTRFMTDRQIDYGTSLVKKGVNINVVMLGFGKTNRQIFLTSVANNQFITNTERGIDIKKARYFIFDNEYAENNKNLNHNYSRYRVECDGANEADYLPLPSMPADEKFFRLDINDKSFYDEIRKICTESANDANFIVIAYGSDLDNMDMAQKLAAKRREWGVSNLTIFVKVRGKHEGQELINEPDCYLIAEESSLVYNIDNILGDKIFRMAQMRNEIYDLEFELTRTTDLPDGKKIESIVKRAREKWYTAKTQTERDSSLYGCLSLRSKLNMMGLDYCAVGANDIPALTEEEYLGIYAGGDRPNASFYPFRAEGKPIVHYNLNFPESRRRDMAIHEHLRWNSFMISKGMIPATKKQILEEEITVDGKKRKTNGRNYSVRRHGNLTTFDGLIEFRRMIADRDGTDETVTDVIKYDYQLLDDAYWLLTKNGFKIIKIR